MAIKIRKVSRFSKRTFEAVLRLLPQLTDDPGVLTEQLFKSILTSGSSHLFIAELDNKKIAGMFTIGIYNSPTGKKVWIEDVVVEKSHRGNGIGKKMMLYAIDYSGSLGAKDVRLTSRPSRIAANELYRSLGFLQYETNFYKYLLVYD
jgi:ribosomal protein S18 acetylase RimI-like enzyme